MSCPERKLRRQFRSYRVRENEVLRNEGNHGDKATQPCSRGLKDRQLNGNSPRVRGVEDFTLLRCRHHPEPPAGSAQPSQSPTAVFFHRKSTWTQRAPDSQNGLAKEEQSCKRRLPDVRTAELVVTVRCRHRTDAQAMEQDREPRADPRVGQVTSGKRPHSPPVRRGQSSPMAGGKPEPCAHG